MNLETDKCVMVIDDVLPPGVIANTAGILGITLGRQTPDIVGPDVLYKTGSPHAGITKFSVPILKAGKDRLKELRRLLSGPEYAALMTVDFSDVAQSCNDYDDYIKKASLVEESELNYYGICICGPKKLVNRLTGSLPLMR